MICSKCGKENKRTDAEFCVHCGAQLEPARTVIVKETPTKTRRMFWACGIIAAVVVVLAIVVPIGICGLIGFEEESEIGALDITESSLTYDIFGWAKVEGTVENTRDDDVTSRWVTARFFDGSGALVHTGSDYIERLRPGERAKFEIPSIEEGVVSYEVFVE